MEKVVGAEPRIASVAELDAHTKNLHSHRAKAMASLIEQMQAVWGPGGR